MINIVVLINSISINYITVNRMYSIDIELIKTAMFIMAIIDSFNLSFV